MGQVMDQVLLSIRLRANDVNGNNSNYSSTASIDFGFFEKRSLANYTIKGYSLEQNYPNPFNPRTSIKFDVKKKGFVSLIIYDISGREVATLVNENKNEGNYFVEFEASNLPSGVYIYRLRVNDFVSTKKMTFLK